MKKIVKMYEDFANDLEEEKRLNEEDSDRPKKIDPDPPTSFNPELAKLSGSPGLYKNKDANRSESKKLMLEREKLIRLEDANLPKEVEDLVREWTSDSVRIITHWEMEGTYLITVFSGDNISGFRIFKGGDKYHLSKDFQYTFDV